MNQTHNTNIAQPARNEDFYHNHYRNACYLYDADSNKHVPVINKADGYLTLLIPQGTIINMVHQRIANKQISDARTICSHFNNRKISKLPNFNQLNSNHSMDMTLFSIRERHKV